MKLRVRNLFKGSNPHQTLTEWHPLEELDDEPAATGWRQDGPGTLHDHQEPCPVCDPADPTAGSAASTATGPDVTSPDAAATEPAQCAATTRSGGQCKFPARPGTDRCALPSHQRI